MTTDNPTRLDVVPDRPSPSRLAPDQLRTLLAAATYLPTAWVIGLSVVAVVSALDVTVGQDGQVSWHVSVGTISLVAVALIWLPTALRLMSLTGGSVKAAGVEAAAAGILSASEDLITDLANVRASTELLAQGEPDKRSIVESVEATVDQIAERYLPAEETLPTSALERLARRYEDIRRTQRPGPERTIAMNRLVNEVRIRAKAAPESARQRIAALLRSDRDGDRIVGLGLAEGSPDAERLDELLYIFASSRSAFEQYHSLLALDEIAGNLGPAERAGAIQILEREQSDPRNTGLMQDPYIPSWIDKVLASLRS